MITYVTCQNGDRQAENPPRSLLRGIICMQCLLKYNRGMKWMDQETIPMSWSAPYYRYNL